MQAIGNFLRFIFFGWYQWLFYMIFYFLLSLTVIFLPIGKSFREMSKLILMPFGKEIIKDKQLLGGYEKGFGIVFNIIWFPIGLILSIFYIIIGILDCISLIGIPFGIVNFKVAKMIFLPIGLRVMTKDEYISYKVQTEINRNETVNNLAEKNIKIPTQYSLQNVEPKLEVKVELLDEEKKEIREKQKELELLKIEEEKEKIKKQKEAQEKREKKFQDLKEKALNKSSKIKKIIEKYYPIILEKIKLFFIKILDLIKKYTPILADKTKNLSKNISKNVKEIDLEKYKKAGTNAKKFEIDKKYLKYILAIFIIIFIYFIGNYIYKTFYYTNQIIKVGNDIILKEQPKYINYFNNNNVKIGVNDTNLILSQSLSAFRDYQDNNNMQKYKFAGYSTLYSMNNNLNIDSLQKYLLDKNIELEKYEKGKLNTLIFNEDIDNYNLYNTIIFKKLNSFTNKKMFFSGIYQLNNKGIVYSGISKNIKKSFGIKILLEKLYEEVGDKIFDISYYKEGFELNNNNLVIYLQYDFSEQAKENLDKENIKTQLVDILKDIGEEEIISYNKSKIEINKNNISIKVIYKLSKSNIKTILEENLLNDLDIINYFTNY